jgi:hypothetical protein
VPTFGRDTIRKFSKNCSALKRVTAWEYEDLLQVSTAHSLVGVALLKHFLVQCAIPVFDGLLPEPHNSRLMDVLYLFAHWHGLAKLRLHIDPTLDILDELTCMLGSKLREFAKKTCPAFETWELKKEVNARNRRQTKKKTKAKVISEASHATSTGNVEQNP